MMRLFLALLFWLAAAVAPAAALSPSQVVTVLPPYQAPGWTGFTPNSLLAAYWRPEALSNGAVSSWADDIAAFALTQGTGSAQPTKAATSCNGTAGVTFTAASSQFVGAAAVTGLPSSSTEGWIFLTVIFPSDSTLRQAFAYGSTGASAQRGIYKSTTNRATIFNTTVVLTDVGGANNLGFHVFAARFVSGSMEGYIDGHPFTTPSVAITLSTATNFTRIGGSPAASPTALWDGVICDVAVVNGALTVVQRQKITAYFAHLRRAAYILPYNHPYRWRKP